MIIDKYPHFLVLYNLSGMLPVQVRREKISERMKYLQDLVPGCNKITGKAGMLDEIINYVQSLQRQVEVQGEKPINLNTQIHIHPHVAEFRLIILSFFVNSFYP